MPSLNIHRNDTVKVLRGSDRGKTGRVLRVFPDKGTLLVEHVRVVKKTVSSKSGQRTKGGIAEQESRVAVSNVSLICGACGPVRIGHEVRGERTPCLEDVRPADALGDVWTHFSAQWDEYARMDYILVSRGMKPELVREKTCAIRHPLMLQGSDHRPLQAVFKAQEIQGGATGG